MKSNWQTKKLGDLVDDGIVQLTRGEVISKKDIAAHPGTYPIYSSAKDNNGMFGRYGKFMFDEPLITWSVDGGGRLFYRPKHRFSVTNVGGVLRILKPELLDYQYLFYVLSLKHSEIRFDWVRKAHPSIIRELYKGIPLPSLPEQLRIVKILHEVFEKTAKVQENTEKNLQNSHELFESYLQNVFVNPGKDWEEKILGNVCDFYNGKAHEKVIDENGAYIVVNSRFIASNGAKCKKTKKALFLLIKGDIAMVMSDVPNGRALAKCFIIDRDNTYSLNQRICAIRSKVFQTRFLYFQLNRHKYLLGFNNGENQTNLRKNDILNCPLFVPLIPEQKSIVAKLDALSTETQKLETVYKQKLTDLEELKKSFLEKAFSGELIQSDKQKIKVRILVLSPYIRNQVHAAIIERVAKDGGWTTEVAVAKYDHLLQEVYGLPLGYQFQTQQFGPFDAQIKRLVWSGLGRNKWFAKRKGMIICGSNINTLLLRQSNIYRAAQSVMKELAKLGVTKLNAEKIELLSTVCHSIKETKSTVPNKIREYMSQWSTDGNRTKADKFSFEQIQKCLNFITKNNLHLRLLKTI